MARTLERHGHLVLVANTGEIIPGLIGPRRPIDPSDGRLDLLVVAGRGIPGGLRSAADLLLRTGDLSWRDHPADGQAGPDHDDPAATRRDRWRRPRARLADRARGPERHDGASPVPEDGLTDRSVRGDQMCCNPVSRSRGPRAP
jgi:hypothetical protein